MVAGAFGLRKTIWTGCQKQLWLWFFRFNFLNSIKTNFISHINPSISALSFSFWFYIKYRFICNTRHVCSFVEQTFITKKENYILQCCMVKIYIIFFVIWRNIVVSSRLYRLFYMSNKDQGFLFMKNGFSLISSQRLYFSYICLCLMAVVCNKVELLMWLLNLF